MMKRLPKIQTKQLAVVLLALWFVIIFGFFMFPLMAHECVHTLRDCPLEFLDEVESMGSVFLLIQFGSFFFIAAVCEFCYPDGFNHMLLEPSFTSMMSFFKVISPPPRFSRI